MESLPCGGSGDCSEWHSFCSEWWCLHHATAVAGRWVWPGKMDFSPSSPSPPIWILKSQKEIESCWAFYFPRGYALTVFKLYLRTGPEEPKHSEPYHLSLHLIQGQPAKAVLLLMRKQEQKRKFCLLILNLTLLYEMSPFLVSSFLIY